MTATEREIRNAALVDAVAAIKGMRRDTFRPEQARADAVRAVEALIEQDT